jgi:hypothetical protein
MPDCSACWAAAKSWLSRGLPMWISSCCLRLISSIFSSSLRLYSSSRSCLIFSYSRMSSSSSSSSLLPSELLSSDCSFSDEESLSLRLSSYASSLPRYPSFSAKSKSASYAKGFSIPTTSCSVRIRLLGSSFTA